jgi:peptidoglycan/xylan/chitin deacetylase (PgdA/CDA1 family)
MRPFVIVRAVYIVAILPLLYFSWNGDLSWGWPLVWTLAYFGILAAGAGKIQWRFFIPSLIAGSPESKQVALSFDDGPAAFTADILDILRLEAVPAAFFAIGHRVAADPETVRRWDNEGHLIGNHSYTHSYNFDWKSAAAMLRELHDTNAAIEAATGRVPNLFRPPYGVTNPALAKAVRRSGMSSIGWTLRSLDTRANDPQALTRRIINQVKGGDVILLHDTMHITATVLTAVIQACREKGFTFVRLDELLLVEPYA